MYIFHVSSYSKQIIKAFKEEDNAFLHINYYDYFKFIFFTKSPKYIDPSKKIDFFRESFDILSSICDSGEELNIEIIEIFNKLKKQIVKLSKEHEIIVVDYNMFRIFFDKYFDPLYKNIADKFKIMKDLPVIFDINHKLQNKDYSINEMHKLANQNIELTKIFYKKYFWFANNKIETNILKDGLLNLKEIFSIDLKIEDIFENKILEVHHTYSDSSNHLSDNSFHSLNLLKEKDWKLITKKMIQFWNKTKQNIVLVYGSDPYLDIEIINKLKDKVNKLFLNNSIIASKYNIEIIANTKIISDELNFAFPLQKPLSASWFLFDNLNILNEGKISHQKLWFSVNEYFHYLSKVDNNNVEKTQWDRKLFIDSNWKPIKLSSVNDPFVCEKEFIIDVSQFKAFKKNMKNLGYKLKITFDFNLLVYDVYGNKKTGFLIINTIKRDINLLSELRLSKIIRPAAKIDSQLFYKKNSINWKLKLLLARLFNYIIKPVIFKFFVFFNRMNVFGSEKLIYFSFSGKVIKWNK